MKRRLFANYGTVTAATFVATAILTACELGDLRAPETRVDWTAAMDFERLAGGGPDAWAALERARLARKAAARR